MHLLITLLQMERKHANKKLIACDLVCLKALAQFTHVLKFNFFKRKRESKKNKNQTRTLGKSTVV